MEANWVVLSAAPVIELTDKWTVGNVNKVMMISDHDNERDYYHGHEAGQPPNLHLVL